ncbi:MAG: acetate kinase [Cyclobacteriaceae bacterium]
MNVFVINSGSSSIKYQLFRMPGSDVVCSGLIDRIGQDGASITHKVFGPGAQIIKQETAIADHAAGLSLAAAMLTDASFGVIRDPAEIDAVGHRVVHGGEAFAHTMEITPEVKEKIKALFPLAPLHNPPNFLGIEVAERIFARAKQVAVFDTAFHQTMEPVAYRMAIPKSFYTDHQIRAYGFHGTSHKYVSAQAAAYLKNPSARLVTIHLGNGCSMAAVSNGKCVDTSMGMGPMNGLIMGTRAGDIDQSVIFHMVSQLGQTLDGVNTILNKKSGMLGLTGHSDMRDVKTARAQGDPDAVLAYDMYAYRIRKYIGAFAAALGGLEAIVFTAGVGENDPLTRALSVQQLAFLGIHLDAERNEKGGKGIYEISTPDSPVKILVVPTNEEWEIANQCFALLK